MTSTIRGKGQLTIPAEIRRSAHLDAGDLVEFEVVAEGILMKPRKVIDATQAWFWEPTWQAMEREVDDHVARSEIIVSDGPDEFFEDLDRQA